MRVIAGALFAGGAFSNVIDRLLHKGCVLNFTNIAVASLITIIFDFADVAIMLGKSMLAVAGIRQVDRYLNLGT